MHSRVCNHQVWKSGLTLAETNQIERVQKAAFAMILDIMLSFSLRIWGSNPQEMLKYHRKFRPKSLKILPFTLKSCRMRLLFKSSSEKRSNYVGKLPQSHRKFDVKTTHFCRDLGKPRDKGHPAGHSP